MILYSNALNLRGLYSKKPVRVYFDEVSETYKDTSGNYEVKKAGLDIQENRITFTSEYPREVECWSDGAIAAMILLSEWCWAAKK
jgi:hypothetical protein